jgi:hypothetical protein
LWWGPICGLLAFVLLVGTGHLLWAAGDGRPPSWDRAGHLERALLCARFLREGAWRQILDLSPYYPPLTHCAAGLLHRLLGPSHLVALLWIQGCLGLLVFATYGIGARLGSAAAGVAAALLVAGYPEIFLESRVFMLDVPLTAVVALTVLALLRSEGFTHRFWSLVAGMLGGLGLLTKWTYPFFLLPIGLYCWFGARQSPEERVPERRGRGRHLLLALAVTAVVAAPWYLRHPLLPLSLLHNAYAGGVPYGDPSPLYYVRALVYQLGGLFAALFALGLLAAWRRRSLRGLGVLVVWVLVPMVVLTLLRNRDYRHTMPILPAVALLSTAWIAGLGSRRERLVLGGLALIVLAHMAFLGWGWPAPEWARGRTNRQLLFRSEPPMAVHWPTAELLDLLVRDRPGEHLRLSVVPDDPYFSRSTFRYYARLKELPVHVAKAWSGDAPLFVDYVLVKTGDQGPAHTTRQARAVMARLEAGDPTLVPLLRPMAELPLPDATRATLYRVGARPAPGLSDEAVMARLQATPPLGLDWAIADSRGLRVEVEPVSPADTARGRFRRLVIMADAARLGDFRRRPQALRVRDVEVVLENVQLNPYALAARGEVELLDVTRIAIRRATILQEDLEQALAGAARWVTAPSVTIRPGRLEVAGGVLAVRLRIALAPDRGPGADGRLGFRLAGLRLGPVPLPAGLLNRVLGSLDPLARLENQPVVIEVPRVTLEEGLLRLH